VTPGKPAITPPSVPDALDRISSLALSSHLEVIDVWLSGFQTEGEQAASVRIESSRLEDVTLRRCDLRGLEARDVVFERCDLTASDFSESHFLRAEFRGCRLSGAVLSMSTFEDVRFTDCKADLLNLRMAEGERVWILDSNLREADFYSAKVRSSRVLGCDLSGSEFSGADLSGTRLQGSRLDGAKGAAGLHGIEVDSGQAALFSKLLLELHEISVDDTPAD
jgi:uncharacterized protein YjbI with pentapeptide repeats